MNVNVGHVGRVVFLLVELAVFAIADPSPVVAGSLLASDASREANRVKDDARRALDNFLRSEPTSSQCKVGFQLGPKRFIVALSKRAEQAGLRRGDLVKTVAGLSIADAQERSRVNAAVSSAVPAEVVIERKGQPISVSVPCVAEPEVWAATKRASEAAVAGDWDACQTAALDIVRTRGIVVSLPLQLRMRCAGVQWSVQRTRETGLRFARATYEWQQARIRERSYEPGGLDEIRSHVLSDITVLRREGFTDFANDLEEQLRLAPQRLAQEEQAIAAAQPQPKVTQGTGFLVRPDGSILTALHVVDGSKAIAVKCEGFPAVSATLGDTARSVDLAVLRTSLTGAPYLSIRDARSVRLGDSVFTIGFPAAVLLGAEPKFTDGSISAMSGPGKEAVLMQITVPVQPGNSGGPVVATDGSVVGVVTATEAVLTFLQVTGTLPQNINWAVKAEYAKPMFDQPIPRPSAKSRGEAIQRATQASCIVLAEH
jgi:S1-C subfamily serine protease